MIDDKANSYVRKCSFNPGENMICVSYDNNGNEKKELYLEVKFRELWFQIYCEENGIKGVIDAGELSLEPINESLLISKAIAKIYMDDLQVARVAAARFVSVGDSDAIQKTVTLAIGRALKEAGFGSLSCLENEDGGDYPCDSGYTLVRDSKNPEKFVKVNSKPNPLLSQTPKEDKANKEKTLSRNPDAQAAEKKPERPAAAKRVTSLKEAYLFKVPFGEYKDRTISEVMAVDSERIRWFSSDSFQANTPQRQAFKEACMMVIKAVTNAA